MSAGTWGLIELMGHRQHYGFISEVTVAGVQMVRVQIPFAEKRVTLKDLPTGTVELEEFEETHTYSASAIYGLHEQNEQAVREYLSRLARLNGPYTPQLNPKPFQNDDDTDDDPSDGVWESGESEPGDGD